ncbi:MAG: hypothetical protein AABM67_03980 [Acidobacteriota bacterium]
MERINTENLNENDSQIGALATPRFTHEAEEHAVPVEKLPEPRTVRGLLGTQISPYWFLAIAIVTTMFLGAVGGAVAGLRENQQPFELEAQPVESEVLGGAVTGETYPEIAAQPAAPITVMSLEHPETKIRAMRRSTERTYRPISSRTLRSEEADDSREQPVARKVGVLSGSSVYWYRKRRVNVQDN